MKIIQEDEDETNSVTESQQPPITVTTVATEFRQTPTTAATSVSSTRSGIDNVTTTTVTGSLAQSTNHTQRELFQQWQSSTREEEVKPQTQDPIGVVNRIGLSGSDNQHPLNRTSCELTRPKEDQANQSNVHVSQAMNTQNASDRNPAQIILRNPDMHKASNNQQTTAAAERAANRPASQDVTFAMLFPFIEPLLDRDRAVQLQTLQARVRSNSIDKEEYRRHFRTLVPDHVLKMAVRRLKQGQVPAARQNTQMASSSLQPSDASALTADQIPRLVDRQSDSHGGQARHASNASVTAIHHQQQLQHKRMNLPQPSFYGNPGGNFHPSASANMVMPSPSYKQQSHDLHMRQGPVNPTMTPQAVSQHALNDMKRLHGRGHTHFTSNPALQQNSSHWQASMHKDQSLVSSNTFAKSDSAVQINGQQHRSHLSTPHGLEHATGVPGSSKDDTSEAMSARPGSITSQLECQKAAAANSSMAFGANAKFSPKKPIAVQKKPLEAPANPLSKKQKVVGAFADQSIEQLNDVTAVSGVNLTSDASTLPANQRLRLLERQSGSHGVKASHVPNANVTSVNRQPQQQQQQLQLQQQQQHVNFPQSLQIRSGLLAQSTNDTQRELFQQSSTPEQEVKPQTQEPSPVVNRIGLSGSDNHNSLNRTSCELTRPKEEQANRFNVHVSQAMNTQNASDRNPAQIILHNPDMHQASNNQQTTAAAERAANRPASNTLAMFVHFIKPLLDRDRAVQLQTLYERFRSNSIEKEEYVRTLRTIVPDHMIKMAARRLNQGQVPAARQNTQRASSSLQPSDASALPANQTPRLLERQSDLHGGQASHASNANVSAINHQQQLQQKRMNLPQPSSPTYGNPGGNFHPSASASMCMPGPSYNQQSHDLQMRKGPVNDMKRLHREGHAHFTSNPALQQNSSHWQASMHKDQSLVSSNPNVKSDSADQMNGQLHRSHLSTPHGLEHATGGPGSSKDNSFEAMSSRPGSIKAQLERQNAATAAAANSSMASGGNAKTPLKKPIAVQKEPLERQSVASTLPGDQRPRLLERQSGLHDVKESHVPNANATNSPSGRPLPFAMLLQFLEPQLDKDCNERLQGLFDRLKNNTINRKEFLRHMGTRRRSYP